MTYLFQLFEVDTPGAHSRDYAMRRYRQDPAPRSADAWPRPSGLTDSAKPASASRRRAATSLDVGASWPSGLDSLASLGPSSGTQLRHGVAAPSAWGLGFADPSPLPGPVRGPSGLAGLAVLPELQRGGVTTAFQLRESRVPPTMSGIPTIGLQRQTQGGKSWVNTSRDVKVGVGETIRLIADGMARWKTVAFIINDFTDGKNGAQVNRVIATAGAGGGANVVLAAPGRLGRYIAWIEVDRVAWADFPFWVSTTPDALPDAPPETGLGAGIGNLFGDLKTFVFIALGVVALTSVAPALRR